MVQLPELIPESSRKHLVIRSELSVHGAILP
jgi:hypothetical protein